jgi:hypothetical protein
MKRRAVAASALIGSVLGLMLFATSSTSRASASSLSEFSSRLLASGYVATPSGTVEYGGFSASAGVVTIEDGADRVTVEVFEYASSLALQLDWFAVPGSPAAPRIAGAEFAGRSAYWNDNSVLVVDFRTPNDPDLARRVGEVFLNQTGASLTPPIASLRQADPVSATSVQPPRTGDAALLLPHDEQALPMWAGALWACLSIATLAFAGAGGFVLLKKARS